MKRSEAGIRPGHDVRFADATCHHVNREFRASRAYPANGSDADGDHDRRGQLARHDPPGRDSPGQCLRVLAVSPVTRGDGQRRRQCSGRMSIDDLRAAAGATAFTFDRRRGAADVSAALMRPRGYRSVRRRRRLHYAQDKLAMRLRLAELGLPVPDFADLEGPDRNAAREYLTEFGRDHDWAVVLKAVRGSLRRARRLADALETRDEALAVFDERTSATAPELIVEQKGAMRRELSALAARSPFGQAPRGWWWRPCSATVVRSGAGPSTRAPR